MSRILFAMFVGVSLGSKKETLGMMNAANFANCERAILHLYTIAIIFRIFVTN